MEHKHSPEEIKKRQASPDAGFFEEISELRDRIARLARSASGQGRELDLHGLLLDELPSPVWIAAANGKCVFFNRSWLAFTGRPMEQELGDRWAQGIHPDDFRRVMATYYEALRESKSFRLEYRLRRNDGRYRNVVDLGNPFFDHHGELAGYIGSVFDFTDRVRAEEELKKAAHELEERVKELTALNGILDLYQRPDQVPVLLNEAVRFLPPAYQYPEVTEARITYGSHIFSTQGYRETPWKQAADFAADDGLAGKIEVVYLEEKPQEDEGPFLIEERTLIDGLAKLTRAFLIRRQADELRSRLASIVENSYDAIIGKTLEGIITDWNPAAERLYGYTAKEAIGRPITIIAPKERAREVRDILENVRSGESVVQFETVRVAKGGQQRDVSITVSPIRDSEGRIVGASVISRDVTERNRVRRELEDAKAQAELYLDLISHDINNMNQTGIGYLELALESLELKEEQRMLLERPLEALENSSRLISNVRKLQKLKSGELKARPINLCAILNELVAHYEKVRDASIKIQRLPVDTCLVMANELVRDVFANLIDNAIKHGRTERPLEIGIGLSGMKEGDRNYFVIVVEDNGPGIPDTVKYRLFKRYQRGETKAGGKGLGLYIVRTLVESYGGRVWVEDRVPGDYTKGSRFVVVLPTAE